MLLRYLMAAALAATVTIGYAQAAGRAGSTSNPGASHSKLNGPLSNNASEYCGSDVNGEVPKGFGQCEAGHAGINHHYVMPRYRYRPGAY